MDDADALFDSDGHVAVESRRSFPPRRAIIGGGLFVVGVVALATAGSGWNGKAASVDYRGFTELDSQKPCRLGSKSQKDGPCAAGKDSKVLEDKSIVKDDSEDEQKEEKREEDVSACTVGKDNCNATQCCSGPGMQCYEQNGFYAQCRVSCTPGPDPTHWDGQAWSCKELGHRTSGSGECSEPGEDCRQSKCCNQVGTQCFEKNDGWATCKSECVEGGPDMADLDGKPWTCKKLGPWTPGAAPWVQGQCANEWEDCSQKGCCAAPGSQCYAKSPYWHQCKYDCQTGKDPAKPWEDAWDCNTTGSRTPGNPVPTGGKVAPWVKETCAATGKDCSKSKCCLAAGAQCYEKNEDWATCMDGCTAGNHLEDNNETWSCKPLGPRSQGLALKGFPSLFCWSLIQTTTYEFGVMKLALGKGAGIFGCDEFAVLSTDNVTSLGKSSDGEEVKTLQVPPAPITTSVDGTAGNAKLFMNCWDVIVADGRWRNHAWTLKVDPDAVMLADRVRTHMAPHFGENVYVVNCNKFPTSPNFPMMYGALEIFSYKAIDVYGRNKGLCMKDMGMMLPSWGEDYFMTHCLDHIGVGRIADFGVLGDMNCVGANCADSWTASFHPFKDEAGWEKCWNTATR